MADSRTIVVMKPRDEEVRLNKIVDNHEVANGFLRRGE
jgi:hypothetical protein